MAEELRINNAQELASMGIEGRIKLFGFPCKVRLTKTKATLSQQALAHIWYGEIAVFFISAGKSHFASGLPINKDSIKNNLKRTFLGTETIRSTNMLTGEIIETQEVRHTSGLDTGEMAHFMKQVEAWAMDNGIPLSYPEDSEYMQYREAA